MKRDMRREKNPNYKHGHSSNGKVSPTYNSWDRMLQRCQNPKYHQFKDYGGRGIKVCERWQDFANFLEDMGTRPEGKTLDRINNDGDYEPKNCRWATRKEQRQNRRKEKDYKNQYFFVAVGKQGEVIVTNNQHEFARQHNLNQGNINNCLGGRAKSHKGWKFYRLKDYLATVVA